MDNFNNFLGTEGYIATRALCDAVESLPVGSAWDLRTVVGPLIRPPRGALDPGRLPDPVR